MDSKLQTFHESIKKLRRDIKADGKPQVGKKLLRQEAERLARHWCKEIAPELENNFSFSPEILKKYSLACEKLIMLSAPNNSSSRYLETIDMLVKPMRAELIVPLQASPEKKETQTIFGTFVTNLSNPEESQYFQESINCAKHGFLRAAGILAWCTAIDRIHKKIELIGFSKFNVTAAQMASQQKGRYKRFNQTQNVSSLSDLREVFDTTILWIIEGMGLIDSNQHMRLRSSYEIRCHCSHPGEAPITEYNLMSVFSDIQQIILENPKFSL